MSLAELERRAHRLYPRSAQLRTVFMRGAYARRRGEGDEACPYPRGSLGWNATRRSAWLRGNRTDRT